MISKAIERNVRMSARKAGLVCDLVRHKTVNYAIAQLENQHHKAKVAGKTTSGPHLRPKNSMKNLVDRIMSRTTSTNT